jgi:hypothetical protein
VEGMIALSKCQSPIVESQRTQLNVTITQRSHVIYEYLFCLDFPIIRRCDEKFSQFQVKVTQVGKDIRHIADRLKATTESIEDKKS